MNIFGIIAILAVVIMLALVPFGALLHARKDAKKRKASPVDRLRSLLAQAQEQGEALDIVVPAPAGSKFLCTAQYCSANAEGVIVSLAMGMGRPVPRCPEVHVYFRIKRHGPYSYVDFATTMGEVTIVDGETRVLLNWPANFGYGQYRRAARPAVSARTANLRLWRASRKPVASSPWRLVHNVLLTDLGAKHLECSVDLREGGNFIVGDPVMCRLTLPGAKDSELALAGAVAHVQAAQGGRTLLKVRLVRWGSIFGAVGHALWHDVDPAHGVQALQDWVQSRDGVEEQPH